MKKKIGIFGGAFNPITQAHLSYAISAREDLNLDEVWLMPTGTHPDKTLHLDPGSDKRLEMLEAATKDFSFLKVSDFEIKKTSVSYTFETMKSLKSQMPENDFWFLLGQDRIKDFTTWDHYQVILENARLGVCLRGGDSCLEHLQSAVDSSGLTEHVDIFHMPPMDISSTDVRNKVQSGHDITELVPHTIKELVHKLYNPIQKVEKSL